MAVTRVTQFSYNSGEIGGLMQGRSDDSKYGSGLARCLNAFVTPQGPIKNRAGFMYVATVKDNTSKPRLIPFTYSADQTVVIELGDKYARFYTWGRQLMDPDTNEPYEIETPWAVADVFDIHYVQNADIMTLVHPNYPPHEIRRYSETDWRCTPVVLNTTLQPPTDITLEKTDGSGDQNADKYTQSYVVTSLNADRTEESEPSAPKTIKANLYATGGTVTISWTAAPGAARYRIYKLQGGVYGYIGETTSLSIVDDNIGPETGQTPPIHDDVFLTDRGIASVQVVDGGSGYARNWMDMRVEGNSFVGEKEEHTLDGITFTGMRCHDDSYLYFNGQYTQGTLTGFYVTLQGNYSSNNFYFNSGGWADGRILSKNGSFTGKARISTNAKHPTFDEKRDESVELVVEDSTGYGAEVVPTVVDGVITAVTVVKSGRNYTDPKIRVVSERGSGAKFTITVNDGRDYPGAVGYFEQRRVFAGTSLRPQQIWMTVTGTEKNMSYHLPLQDTDRISFEVASRDMNLIRHVVSLQQLIALTSAAEWRVSPLNSDAITPDSISVRPQSYIGASNVQPQIVNSNAFYCAARGGHVREFSYSYNAGGYISGDVSLRASHLFGDEDPITELALSKSPDQYLWALKQGGTLLGFCYVPDQQVGAWFEYETDGVIESVAVVQEGATDSVYAVVRRNIGGTQKRFVERKLARDDDAMGSGLFLDCAGQFNYETKTTKITGATWLAGATVTVVADGGVYRGFTMDEDGSVTLPKPVQSGWIGLTYETIIRTLPVSFQIQDGSYGRGHTKNVNRVWMRVENTTGVEVGPDLDNMKPMKVRRDEAYGEAVSLQSGEIDVGSVGHWQKDGSFYIRQAEPAPFTLISHTAEIEIGG